MPSLPVNPDPSQLLGRVLVVDDQEGIRTQLRWGLADRFEVTTAGTPDAALQAMRGGKFDAVTLDLGLPPDPDGASEGLRLLETFLAHDPAVKIVVLTGNEEHQNAVLAVQHGAFDFYRKPGNIDELKLILERACRLSRLDRETFASSSVDSAPTSETEIVSESPAMKRILDTAKRVARTDVTVLISGESGTGKELIARAIHAQSPRRRRPFVAINCGAIPEGLVESELFGHEKGSFTGAHVQRNGRLEMGDGGTVFLDEIGELTPLIQVKLLRVLQERQIERVGGREVIGLDIRVLAATNHDLRRAMAEGKFREDLYYRLAVVRIEIPPLRERADDLRAMATRFLERFCGEFQMRRRPFSGDAISAILNYAWPGNVRELENRIKRAILMATGRRITSADLELDQDAPAKHVSLKEARNSAERGALIEALQRAQGNVSRASKLAGLSRPAFHELLTKHGIHSADYRLEKGGPDEQ